MEHVGQLIAGLDDFVRDYGVLPVTVILALEALGVPAPGETLLIFASVLVGRGEMSLPALLIFAWMGSDASADRIADIVAQYRINDALGVSAPIVRHRHHHWRHRCNIMGGRRLDSRRPLERGDEKAVGY
jgi:hypothetical protein